MKSSTKLILLTLSSTVLMGHSCGRTVYMKEYDLSLCPELLPFPEEKTLSAKELPNGSPFFTEVRGATLSHSLCREDFRPEEHPNILRVRCYGVDIDASQKRWNIVRGLERQLIFMAVLKTNDPQKQKLVITYNTYGFKHSLEQLELVYSNIEALIKAPPNQYQCITPVAPPRELKAEELSEI